MKKKKELNSMKFSAFYIVIALLFFGVIIVRTYDLSMSKTIDGIDLQEFANNRITRNDTIFARRGTIFDVKGDVLSQNVSSYTLIAYLSEERTTDAKKPKHVVDKEHTAEQLATVIDLSPEKILEYLSKDNLYQTEFGSKGRGLTELTKDNIKALGLPGIDFIETQKRYYPYGDFLSYTLGYAKTINEKDSDGLTLETIVGEMGIEKYCNTDLTGINGYNLYQKDRSGYKIPGTVERRVEAKDGKDIYLTIDATIQLFVEQAMSDSYYKYGYEWMTVMLMDAKTGAILASATHPSFDPNVKDIKNYYNYNISHPYEPGSTMKIFSYMAAMENDVYDGTETYKSGIFTAKDGTNIGDWDRQGWGTLTFDQGFSYSSNVAVSHLINRHMNSKMLMDYYKKLGFGEKTGIELPGESAGKINFKYETEVLNAGFGQGILTTPIQNIKALSAIANNGILLNPYIIDKIVDPATGEVVFEGGKQELERVASEATVSKIKELMANVINGVYPSSTGYYYNMSGYDLIAKTGTAQVANSNGKGYSNTDTIRGLAGMFPGDDPEVIIYIAAKNPGGTDGSAPMKLTVQSIIKNVSKYLNIYDEAAVNTRMLKTYDLKSYTNKNTEATVATLESAGIPVVVIGNGDKIIDQYPKAGISVNELNKIFLVTNSKEIKIPNLYGYSSKDLYTYLRLVNVKHHVTGTGYVMQQSVEAGSLVSDDMFLEVALDLIYKNNNPEMAIEPENTE